jgi:hypothetical protein
MKPTVAISIVAIGSLAWAVLGIAGLVPAGFSVMLFDAPGSTSNPSNVGLFLLIASFPVFCLAAIVAGITDLCRKKYQRATLWMCLPFPSFCFVAGLVLYALLTGMPKGR